MTAHPPGGAPGEAPGSALGGAPLLRGAATLGLAAAGGAVLAWMGAPLAWLLGAMAATTAGTLLGLPLVVPRWLRRLMIAVLGILLGSAFSPDLVHRMPAWAGSLAVVAATVPAMMLTAYFWFHHFGKFDRTTALLSSTPGGLSEMTYLGELHGADLRALGLAHATRILLVVTVVPLYFRLAEGIALPSLPRSGGSLAALGLLDAATLLACGLMGVPLGALLRLPASHLTGPLLLSIGAHVGGLTHAAPPSALVAAAQIVIGGGIGCFFTGISLRRMWRIVLLGAGSGLIMIAAAAAIGVVAAPFLHTGRAAMALALAPGGLAEMSLIALSLGIDTAFVATMQLARVSLVVAVAPFLFRRIGLRAAEDEP